MASAPPLEIREATEADLPAIVALLADDMLGAGRETGTLDPAYLAAFRAIQAEPNCRELVAVADGAIVGCFQLNLIPGLGRKGSWRAQIELVRVARARRDAGIGAAMMRWAIERGPRGAAVRWSSSPPTSAATTPTASTAGSASWRPTRA